MAFDLEHSRQERMMMRAAAAQMGAMNNLKYAATPFQ